MVDAVIRVEGRSSIEGGGGFDDMDMGGWAWWRVDAEDGCDVGYGNGLVYARG
jgi:hypothetical protein